MADLKISQLTAITTLTPATDVLPVVDVTGTTKKITTNQLLGASGTATLASATITGDLTVATDRLKVVTGSTAIQTGATTQLQIGTTSWPSTVIGKSGSRSLFGNAGEVIIWNESAAAIGNYSTLFVSAKTGAGATTMGGLQIRAGIENASNSDGFVSLFTSNNAAGGFVERYKIDSTGVATWSNVGGVAGTAMTLNSSGLGIGVTPSAWESTFKAIQINNRGAYISATSNSFSTAPFIQIGNNGYYDATNARWQYVTANTASQYVQAASSHYWYTAASGAAGAAITDFATPKMTLDASGNLILLSSNTPATLTTNGQLTVNATSNTNLRFSYRGSDGVTRVANITLA